METYFLRILGHFNPLPPHGGRRIISFTFDLISHFNPLPPHGGRPVRTVQRTAGEYFNPLPPHGGRPLNFSGVWLLRVISIHSLRMEGDLRNSHHDHSTLQFQSTPSAWRETTAFRSLSTSYVEFQSTPSAWRETFLVAVVVAVDVHHFNPLPPHGGRR